MRKKNTKKYEIFHDGVSGLWYARPTDKDLGWDWRKKCICLGYPKKDAYAEARKLKLI